MTRLVAIITSRAAMAHCVVVLLLCASAAGLHAPPGAVLQVRSAHVATSRPTVVMGARGRQKKPLTEEEKREQQLKRRTAGVKALKSLASVYRERNTASSGRSTARSGRSAPLPRAPAAPPAPPPLAEPPPPAQGLLGTLGALAAAKMELAVLRRRDALTDAVTTASDNVRAAPGRAAEKVQAATDRAAAKVQGEVDDVRKNAAAVVSVARKRLGVDSAPDS
jgi:hypothetical protein